MDAGAPVGDATGTELFSAAQVQATLAHCSDPEQPQLLPNPPTIGGLHALLEGAWIECPTAEDSRFWTFVLTGDRPANTQSNVFNYYELLFDANGGLVQAIGAMQTGVWGLGGGGSDLPDAGDSASLTDMPILGIWFAGGAAGVGGYGYPLLETTMPVRMYLYPEPTLKMTRLGDAPKLP